MEVVKIRLQAQVHSMTDPLDVPKYRNAAHALWLILREEGPSTLYRGVALTALRQATNQGEFALRELVGVGPVKKLTGESSHRRRRRQPPTLPPTPNSSGFCNITSPNTRTVVCLLSRPP